MTKDAVIAALRQRVSDKGSQKDVAEELGISTTHLSDVLSGKRNLGEGVLDELGFVKITFHVRADHASRVRKLIEAAVTEDRNMQKLLDKVLGK